MTRDELKRFQALAEWMDHYKLEMGHLTCGTSAVFLADRGTPDETVVAVTVWDEDVLAVGEDLREQFEGSIGLFKAGYLVNYVLEEPAWKPGVLELYSPDQELRFSLAGAETWTAAVREALAWAFQQRLLDGAIAAVEV